MIKVGNFLKKVNRNNQVYYLLAFITLFSIAQIGISHVERRKFESIWRNRLDAISTELSETNSLRGDKPLINAGIEFRPPNFSENSKATISLVYIQVYLPERIKADQLCLTSPLFYYEVVRNPFLTLHGTIPPTNNVKEICLDLLGEEDSFQSEGKEYSMEIDKNDYQTQLFSNVYESSYPYDRYSVNVSFSASCSFYYKNQIIYSTSPINLPIFLAYNDYIFVDPLRYSGYLVNVSRNRAIGDSININKLDSNNSEEYLNFDLQRPIFIQIILPVIFFVIYSFIFLLLFTTDLGSFMGGSVGVFFGLFSIKNVLVPQDINTPTIIDSGILYAYLAFSVVFILFVVRNFIFPKSDNLEPPNLNMDRHAQ